VVAGALAEGDGRDDGESGGDGGGPMCSASSSADHTRVSIGWASWSWAIRAMPPAARPRYQAKNPANMLMTLT